MAAPDERLQAFLYLLMRDHLPSGKVAEIIKQIPDEDERILYAPELNALAYRYALKIIPEPEESPEQAQEKQQAWLAAAPMRILEELSREDNKAGLTLEELGAAVGWEMDDDDDVRECGSLVQRAYEAGHIQRDSNHARLLITADGEAALAAWRAGADG